MASTKRRYSKEEFARRGDAVYENDILPQLAAEDEGKFAAIVERGQEPLSGIGS